MLRNKQRISIQFLFLLCIGMLIGTMTAAAQPQILEITPQAIAAAPDLRPGDVLIAAHWNGGEVVFDGAASVLQFQWQNLPRGGASVQIERDGRRFWLAWAPMSVELALAAPSAGTSIAAKLDQSLVALNAARFSADTRADGTQWQTAWGLVSGAPELAHWRPLTALLGAKAARGGSRFDHAMDRASLLDGARIAPVMRSALVEAKTRALMGLRQVSELAQLLEGAGLDLAGGSAAHAIDAQLLVRTAWLRGQQGNFAEGLRLARLGQAALSAYCSDCLETAAALDAQAMLLVSLDQPAEAYQAQHRSVEMWRSLQPRSERTALAMLKLAGYASRAGKQTEAIDLAVKAKNLLQEMGASSYQRGLAANVVGTQWVAAGRIEEAESNFRFALNTLGDTPQERVLRAQIQNNLGLMLKQHGELAAAYAALLDSVRSYQAQKLDQGTEYAAVAANVANMERLRGDLVAASDWLDRSLSALGSPSRAGPRRVYTLIDMAALSAQQGRHDDELARLAEAQVAAAQTPDECPCRALADLHQGVALVLTDPVQALRLLERAARAFEQAGLILDLARSESAGARALSALGKSNLARRRAKQAAERWLLSFPDSIEHAEALHVLGRIEQESQRPAAARKALCAAADVLDRASYSLGADDFNQMRFRAQYAEVYRDCVWATLDVRGAKAALDVFLRGRQIAWQQGLQQRALAGADHTIATRFKESEREYDRAYLSLNRQGASKDEQARALERVTELRRQRSQLQAKLVPVGAGAVVNDLQAVVTADEIMLVYALGEQRGQLFVVRSNQAVVSLPLSVDREQLRLTVLQWRALIAQRRLQDLPEIRRLGGLLYQQLLGPVRADLRNYPRLVVIPDDALNQLPFAALWDPDARQYLVEKMSIRIADGLVAPAAGAVPKQGQWVAMADAAIDGIESAPNWTWLRAGRLPLSPLPGARREVEALSEMRQDTALYLGAQASESRLKSAAADADVLHLAVHTLLDSANPMESALVLAPDGKENGLLQVWEVLDQLRLHARLVVLSGCETAAGAQFDGEGVMGFVRAFHRAGASSVIASLWPTHDVATAELVRRFYRARPESTSEADALRNAMRDLLREAPTVAAGGERGVGGLTPRTPVVPLHHPWYWASLQVHADQ